MGNLTELKLRAGNCCELCKSQEGLIEYEVSPSDGSADQSVALCSTCYNQIQNDTLDESHFNCLNDSMWSEVGAVKVLSFRLLSKMGRQDLLDMMYLEESERDWAEAGIKFAGQNTLEYRDANGVLLQAGDTVVITKDLDVKGAGFTAKRGTAVRNISLVPNDPTHIEGRVNGVKIYILTQYLKKS